MDDHPGNLISLCRSCHNFVHGLHENSPRKPVCQFILFKLIEERGVTGMQLLRRERRRGTFVGME